MELTDLVYSMMELHEIRKEESNFREAKCCFNCESSWINEAEELECIHFGMDIKEWNVCDKWEGRNESID